MIFPTQSVLKLRGELEDRVSAGQLDEAGAYREALAADPHDPRALRLLALLAEDEDDFTAAEELAWRLLHAMWLAGADEVDRALVDRMLARGPDYVPLLTGVLNLYGEDLLAEVDDALVARAMPLLGEIGSPDALP